MNTLQCDAFLFDLDATLVDSLSRIESIWGIWCDTHGFELAAVRDYIHGRTVMESLRLIAPHLATRAGVTQVEDIAIDTLSDVGEISGAAAFLAKLPRDCWAVVTSGARRVSLSSLNNAGLPVPDVFITAEDVQNSKPHPEPYLKAAGLLHVAPQRCVVFEDSNAGIRSGLDSGARVIGLSTSQELDAACGAALVVRDFTGLDVRRLPHGAEARFEIFQQD